MLDRLAFYKTQNRKKISRQKFFNGLYAEYTGIAFNENGYLDSNAFCALLNKVAATLDETVDNEHRFYKTGKTFLDLKKFEKDKLDIIKKMLGDNWKAIRFQNLVRLGADIENAGLASFSRATLTGAFLFQKEKIQK